MLRIGQRQGVIRHHGQRLLRKRADLVIVAARDTPDEAHAREELTLNPPRSPHDIFPVPIREDLVVYLQNIPLDMSADEARKISAVVQALALPEKDL